MNLSIWIAPFEWIFGMKNPFQGHAGYFRIILRHIICSMQLWKSRSKKSNIRARKRWLKINMNRWWASNDIIISRGNAAAVITNNTHVYDNRLELFDAIGVHWPFDSCRTKNGLDAAYCCLFGFESHRKIQQQKCNKKTVIRQRVEKIVWFLHVVQPYQLAHYQITATHFASIADVSLFHLFCYINEFSEVACAVFFLIFIL